jgi:hypothetical protein
MASGVALHPAENRGYRELYATARAAVRHWSRLGARAGEPSARDPLEAGVAATRRLLAELPQVTVEQDLHGGPAALGLGGRVAGFQNAVADRFLERNQALRVAALEARHLLVLAGYLARVGEAQGAEARTSFCRRWEAELDSIATAISAAAVEQGADPDAAIEPADDSATGRAGHRVAYAVGAAGEWIDRRAARRGA